jgi:2-(1,2-epoxy-1,2-dihydrophenyl)acetyl-CoA isomerase
MVGERDTGTTHLRSTIRDGALWLTLERPDARNAMTDPMLEGLSRELAFAEASGDVRCVVLQGAGRAFCAGGDVKGMGAGPVSDLPIDRRILWQRRIQRDTAGRLATMPKPTIAVINGPAAGAGLSLALACDVRLMADSAFFLTAFASVGLSGDFGATYFLTRLVGSAKAREFMFLSNRISAADAVSLGMANWSCPLEELDERAAALAARLAAAPTTALGYMKENLNRAVAGELGECLDIEATLHVHCMATEDHHEGVLAFAEKRPPSFGSAQAVQTGGA